MALMQKPLRPPTARVASHGRLSLQITAHHRVRSNPSSGEIVKRFFLLSVAAVAGVSFVAVGATFFLSGFTPFIDVHYHSIFPKSGQAVRENMILASFGLKF